MTKEPKVILVEFNELSPALVRQFIDDGHLPNFKRLYSESQVYLTDAEDEPPNLEPWIQWVTVHSGLGFDKHRVFHLGDGARLAAKCIWDVVSDAGQRVWVCGSMNVRYDRPINGYILPDAWTAESAPHPDWLQPYHRFVKAHVLEHTNEKVPVSLRDNLEFLSFMIRHGLTSKTVAAIAKQLLSERRNGTRWKRAVINDKLQFDLFRWGYEKLQPHFSTFFLNSTAHFQHMYWRNMQPEAFRLKPSDEEQARLQHAIRFGYQHMDQLLGSFMELADENTTIVFCTALSQQPCVKYEEQGGKTFYRPHEFQQLLEFAGVEGNPTVAPVMSEQFHVKFATPDDAERGEARLAALRVGDRPALVARRDGTSIFSGCPIFDAVPRDSVLKSAATGRSVPFFDIFYRAEGLKSGMHHPDGMLWIRRPERRHAVHPGRVSLTTIAPTILEVLSVAPPSHIAAPALFARAG